MFLWRSSQDRTILLVAIIAFLLLCLVNIRLPVLSLLGDSIFTDFLISDATASTIVNLLTGLISAYIFYIAIDLLPRFRKHQAILRVLNLLVASVVDAYERERIFGHETPITSIDLVILKEDALKQHAKNIQQGNIEFLKLKFAMQTAHSRYQDFQHSLGLAASLSPECALEWLVLCDKVRLLFEVYEEQKNSPATENSDEKDKRNEDLNSTLKMRVMEVMEAFACWVKLTTK